MKLSELRQQLVDASGACAISAQQAADTNAPGSEKLAQAYAESAKAIAEALHALGKLAGG